MISFKTDCFEDAKMVRERVFMDEQGFENEFEALDEDPTCVHVTAYEDDACIGCARMFPADAEGQVFELVLDEDEAANDADAPIRWIFGRLAVLPEARKGGIGSSILEECERVAKERGVDEMHLHAQCAVTPFYAKAGYEPYGPIELDEGVEHRWMRKVL